MSLLLLLVSQWLAFASCDMASVSIFFRTGVMVGMSRSTIEWILADHEPTSIAFGASVLGNCWYHKSGVEVDYNDRGIAVRVRPSRAKLVVPPKR